MNTVCYFLRAMSHRCAAQLASLAAAACLLSSVVCAQDAQGPAARAANAAPPSLKILAAKLEPTAQTSMILAATQAGKRIVAVGERGVVLLSDDAGTSFRQAKSVPISSTLTSVKFVDARIGWAAGHWGVI